MMSLINSNNLILSKSNLCQQETLVCFEIDMLYLLNWQI